jgi:hypothetical protein
VPEPAQHRAQWCAASHGFLPERVGGSLAKNSAIVLRRKCRRITGCLLLGEVADHLSDQTISVDAGKTYRYVPPSGIGTGEAVFTGCVLAPPQSPVHSLGRWAL